MRKISILFLVFCLMLLAGCNYKSMNSQRAGLRGAADISATLALDNVSFANVDAVQKETKEVAQSVIKFLESGNIGDLTTGQIRVELMKIVPFEYQLWVDLALNYVSQYNLDPGMIGNKTVAHLNAFFSGIEIATDRYKKSDREEITSREIASLEMDKVRYNNALRKRMKRRR